MIPECEFPNVHSLALEMRETAELVSGLQLSPRPWNRFEPENTRWWLVPSRDWPAYHHGKLSLDPTDEEGNVLFCGFDVEKGVAPIVGEGYPAARRRDLIMADSWTWHRFMTDLTAGVVGDVVQELAHSMGQSMRLEFRTEYASNLDEFNPEARLNTLLVFEIGGTELSLTKSEGEHWRFQPVASCAKLAELPYCMQAMHDLLEWIWIDLYFGILVSRGKKDEPVVERGELWSSTDLWEKALMSWQPWLV